MNVIVICHPDRLPHVEVLQKHVSVVTTVIDTVSALSGHKTALRMAAAQLGRVVIMEDDAIPVKGFDKLVKEWCDMRPDDLLSFYLGSGRPIDHQTLVSERIRIADRQGRREIQMPTLLHGVCYSVPPQELPRMIRALDQDRRREADFAIGAAWGKAVYYPVESLVQHRDGPPVERHPDGRQRTEQRVARRLAGPLMFNP